MTDAASRTTAKPDGAARRAALALMRGAARLLAKAVAERFPGSLHSVVLYGSAARGDIHPQSDIDILVLCEAPDELRRTVVSIEDAIDAGSDYTTFLTSQYLTVTAFAAMADRNLPFAIEVLKEGEVLFDDGAFGQLRGRVDGSRSPNAGGRPSDAGERQTQLGS